MAASPASRSPHLYMIPVRIGVVTFIGTLLCFAVSLLFSILGTVILGALRGVHPDMRVAYRHIALPMAIVAGSIILVLASLMEIRHYRQAKSLAAIEKMSKRCRRGLRSQCRTAPIRSMPRGPFHSMNVRLR